MLGLVWLLPAASASARPVSFTHGTVDQTFTTAKPNAPTGASFAGVYHAAGDPKGNPPYMRRMVFFPPKGMRYDTSVPARCTASDLELEQNGLAACPKGSRIGGGSTEGIFYEPLANALEFSRYKNALDIVNNANEQVMLIQTPGGYTVVRGKIRPDQSIEYASPTCFPAPPAGQQCARDYILQLKSTSFMHRIGRYATTPRTCPKRSYWRERVKFWWADGSIDDVGIKEPCKRR